MRLAAGLLSVSVLVLRHGLGVQLVVLAARLAPFVLGAMAMASAVAALFFGRFYRDSRDPYFCISPPRSRSRA
jgi:hypothetical protein